MKTLKAYLVLAASAAVLAVAAPANAAITDYTGLDAGWNTSGSAGPNSAAAQSSFIAAASPLSQIDFANPLPSGVSLSGSGAITNVPGCGFSLCGGNVTSSNGYYLSMYGGSETFNFVTPSPTSEPISRASSCRIPSPSRMRMGLKR